MNMYLELDVVEGGMEKDGGNIKGRDLTDKRAMV